VTVNTQYLDMQYVINELIGSVPLAIGITLLFVMVYCIKRGIPHRVNLIILGITMAILFQEYRLLALWAIPVFGAGYLFYNQVQSKITR